MNSMWFEIINKAVTIDRKITYIVEIVIRTNGRWIPEFHALMKIHETRVKVTLKNRH